MKSRMSLITAAICAIAFLTQSALPQEPANRPRRVVSTSAASFDVIAGKTIDTPLDDLRGGGSRKADATTLESVAPREGLQFYFEVQSAALGELAGSPSFLAPLGKLLGPGKAAASNLASFVARNFAQLSTARLAVAGYGRSGSLALIEAANSADAERLRADLAAMVAATKSRVETGVTTVGLKGRVVMAGEREAVARIMDSNQESSIADDETFMRARARFAGEPIFGYVEIKIPATSWANSGSNAPSPAYAAGALTAINSLPSAIVFGGSIRGETASVRALVIQDTKKPGLLSSLLSGRQAAQPMASSFASRDADLFIDLMVDWEKLFDGIQSVFETVGGQAATNEAGTGSVDLLAAADASLGFSMRNDLIPALGNEVAFSISGLDGVFRPATAGTQKPRFALMLAVRDPVKFERLVGKLVSKFSGPSAQPFARAVYRGAAISYRTDLAYTVSGGFFILAGGRMAVQTALDGHAAGTSLGSSPRFLAAIGEPRPAILQAYLSPGVAKKIFDSISSQAAKGSPEMSGAVRNAAQPSAAGFVMTPDPEGLMLELRVPAQLALAALGSLMTSDPSAYGITSSQSTGNGGSSRSANGRRSPVLTTDDVKKP